MHKGAQLPRDMRDRTRELALRIMTPCVALSKKTRAQAIGKPLVSEF
jgi:hypothetical protein